MTPVDPIAPVAPGGQLLLGAGVALAVLVLLITVVKLHPFLALLIGGVLVGVIAGEPVGDVLDSFGTGFGDTSKDVGILIALGAMFAKLLADSGGADQIVDTILRRASGRGLPWAMALVGALIGLPMFFEIGLVLLMPVIYLVARRSGQSLVTVGLPAIAGLSAMHGLVPPHPGPLTAISYVGADLGPTLALGVLVAVPTIAVAGPVFSRYAGRWVPVGPPEHVAAEVDADRDEDAPRPRFTVTLATVLLPVLLMLSDAVAKIALPGDGDADHPVRLVLDVLGTPLVALFLAVAVAMLTLGRGSGMRRQELSDSIGSSLPAIAGILLIVAAGGGFKQVLVDTGIGTVLADWARGADVSVLLLAWVLAALIRLATGSATIATITAATLMHDIVVGLPTAEVSLVVLAVGAGSVFFSHVNDAGFWLFKEYFGTTVGQTIASWSLMETVLSVSGLGFVLLLGLVV